MKKQISKNIFVFIGTIILYGFFLLFDYSCQKETSINNTNSKQLAATASVNSTIIYTNIDPDSTIVCTGGLTSQTIQKAYSLDLNKDGIADFIFVLQYQRLARCTTGYNNFVRASAAVGTNNAIGIVNSIASALDTLATINTSLSTWGTGGILAAYNYQCYTCEVGRCTGGFSGNWTNGSVKYLALKLIKGSDIYYGWVRLLVTEGPGSKLTVMDYAYNSTPGQQILAGQIK